LIGLHFELTAYVFGQLQVRVQSLAAAVLPVQTRLTIVVDGLLVFSGYLASPGRYDRPNSYPHVPTGQSNSIDVELRLDAAVMRDAIALGQALWVVGLEHRSESRAIRWANGEWASDGAGASPQWVFTAAQERRAVVPRVGEHGRNRIRVKSRRLGEALHRRR
jgi:hypothetical protein